MDKYDKCRCDECRYKVRVSKGGRRKAVAALFVSVLFFVSVWVFLSYSVNPVIRKISEEKVRELSAVAVNAAARTVIAETAASYDKIIEITQNKDGEIEMMRVNSMLVSQISQQMVNYAQNNISAIGAQGIDVPLGSLSGLTFLSGQGPDVKIKVYPVGTVRVIFDSEFISAGINQTRHRINLLVAAEVSVIMPGANRSVSTNTELTLAENIIIGKVPLVYLGSDTLSDMLNLVA